MSAGPRRYLGIDHGTRRLGLAYGDEIGVATPLPAIAAAEEAKQWTALAAVVAARRITDIVLGLPLNMDGSSGPKAREVEAYGRRVAAAFGLAVHYVDERLTSYEAESTIAPSRRREVRRSGLIDSRAATLILQDFLDTAHPGPPPAESLP